MSNVRPFPATDGDPGDYIDRPVPADTAAETAVLSACMYDATNIADAEHLTPADFYHPAHRLVWSAIRTLAANSKPTNTIAVHAELDRAGQLRLVRGGDYLFEIAQAPAVSCGYFADIVFEKARARRAAEFVLRVQDAITSGADGNELDRLVAEHQTAEQQRTDRASGVGPTHLLSSALNWEALFATDFGAVQLLLGRLMAPGQQIALVGDGKAGKSLFAQEWLWRAVTGQWFLGDRPKAPIRVTYIDAENGQPELQSRFIAFGADPRTLGNFTYLSFPPIRPLDTAGGGQDLLAVATATRADLVVIDTVSRFIEGKENDADTWLNLYRHTTVKLKAAGIGSVRLDHLGKDGEKGARGSSAKTQDVDHVWELRAAGGNVLTLKRTHSRTGIGPDQFSILRRGEQINDQTWAPGKTRHDLMTFGERATLIEGSPEWIVDRLDRAGIPNSYGRDRLKLECARLNIAAATSKLEAVAKIRKARENLPSNLPSAEQPALGLPAPRPAPEQDKTPGQTCPGQVENEKGQTQEDLPAPTPSLRRGQVGTRAEAEPAEKPLCTLCGTPMNTDWAARGYDTHLLCDTTPDEP